MLKILIYPILVLVSRGPRTIFTSLTRSLGSDTDILPSNAESSKQNRGRATGGCNLITFRAPRIKGKFSNYVAKLHYILKCATGPGGQCIEETWEGEVILFIRAFVTHRDKVNFKTLMRIRIKVKDCFTQDQKC